MTKVGIAILILMVLNFFIKNKVVKYIFTPIIVTYIFYMAFWTALYGAELIARLDVLNSVVFGILLWIALIIYNAFVYRLVLKISMATNIVEDGPDVKVVSKSLIIAHFIMLFYIITVMIFNKNMAWFNWMVCIYYLYFMAKNLYFTFFIRSDI